MYIRCDGENSCDAEIQNNLLTNPCYGTYKYATIHFKCSPPCKLVVDPYHFQMLLNL